MTIKVNTFLLICFSTIMLYSCNSNGKSDKTLMSVNDSTGNKDRINTDSGSVKATNADTGKTSTAKLSSTNSDQNVNQNIINYMVTKNTKEIIWLKAALDHGMNKDLRAHSKMMLMDHEKLAGKVKDLINKNHYTIPAIDTSNEVNINDKIGADWDKAWTGKLVADHMELMNMLNKAEKDVKDDKLKEIVTSTIPVVKSHLAMAQSLDKKIR